MKKFISLFGIIVILIFAAYLESSYSFFDQSNDNLYNYPNIPVVNDTPLDDQVDTQVNEDVIKNIIPTLELKLEDKEEVNGYIIETYREYEVYQDENENVLKSIPTDKYEFLKYEK